MFKSIHEIATDYIVTDTEVEKALSRLGILGAEHEGYKSFFFVQYITHGIAEPIDDADGHTHSYRYNLDALRDEFEKILFSQSIIKQRVSLLLKQTLSCSLHDTTKLRELYKELSGICTLLEKRIIEGEKK